ncbi:GEM-like protein 4 [Amaranthus tricolor]|uniref:GEM-like protein 4 n=1 Tax=Amaranthus tricolor TaxID=29722 RepID=UPI002586D92A|nr:GEM-like protein 4 [Amaranthus tricolor]
MEARNLFKSVRCMFGDEVLRNGLSTITAEHLNKSMKLIKPQSSLVDVSISNKIQKKSKKESVINTMKKLAKGSLGAKILQGGLHKVFKRIFNVSEGEQLLKASTCSLFTTAGPITGRLFVSSKNLAFCSDKAIATYTSPSGEVLRYHYKVVIPLRKIKKANPIENADKPSKKYLQVVTTDDFEFWFTGFLNYKRTVKCLYQALSYEA